MALSLRYIVLYVTIFACRNAVASRPKEEVPAHEITLEAIASVMPDAVSKTDYLKIAGDELASNEALLMSVLRAVPNGDGDRFAAPAVRFALHKHFVRQYGWHLKGLEPAGASWNSSSPMEAIVFQRLPVAARSLFEKRLTTGGLLAREVAVLAATLELLVHSEAQDRLRGVMRMVNLKTSEPMTAREARKVQEWYMTSFMLGKSPWTTPRIDLKQMVAEMPGLYPAWPQVQEMIDGIAAQAVMAKEGPHKGEVEYHEAQGIVEQIGHRFGPWQHQICSRLKSSLMELRDDGTGRVALADFYEAGLNGKWEFQESAEYMQKSGSLDVSTPSSPRVIIPNWVYSPSNCLGTSETHDVCCISECEPLLAALERAVGGPTATPTQIADLVSNLPSPTQPAGRQLSTLLLSRLQAIAAAHDGEVPLASRLFAQWVHHAYPRECPYPHLSGATAAVNVFAWEASHAELPIANVAAMQEAAARKVRSDGPVLNAPWTNDEELLVDDHHSAPVGAAVINFGVACAAAGIAMLGLVRSAVRAVRQVRGDDSGKLSVKERRNLRPCQHALVV